MSIESFSDLPLQTVIESYLYHQYSDDSDLQAFVDSFNALTQGYLDWFNATPLSVYTNASISGLLLDWVGAGIYGIPRPVLSTLSTSTSGEWNTVAWNTAAWNEFIKVSSGTALVASDDIYKRVLTWHLYRGDGMQMSIPWLRRRVARFIYGSNGSDIGIDELQNIGITVSLSTATITVPNNSDGSYFQQCAANNVLALPFQMSYTVTLA